MARMPPTRANANNGAVIAMITSDANSLVVIAFMRWCVAIAASFVPVANCSANDVALYNGCATTPFYIEVKQMVGNA
jgi:hypothetical protein